MANVANVNREPSLLEKVENVLTTRIGYEKVAACARGVFEFLKETTKPSSLKEKFSKLFNFSGKIENAVGVFAFAYDIVELCKGEWWAGKDATDKVMNLVEHSSLFCLHSVKTLSLAAAELSVGTAMLPVAGSVAAVAVPIFCVMALARSFYNEADVKDITISSLSAVSASCEVVYNKLLPAFKSLNNVSLAFEAAYTVSDLCDYFYNFKGKE